MQHEFAGRAVTNQRAHFDCMNKRQASINNSFGCLMRRSIGLLIKQFGIYGFKSHLTETGEEKMLTIHFRE